jgi:hypothetical protein
MSITTYCSECEQQTVNGVLRHTAKCSANNFIPQIATEQRPPSLVINFDSKTEQEAWMEKLKNGDGSRI